MNLNAVKDYRVLFIGDAIHDRYVFVSPLGKSIKESVISVRYEREEVYPGGVWAAAAHLRELCARVDVMHGPRLMVNSRFVDGVYNRKLFTLHEAKDAPECAARDIAAYDVVVVSDFGHGTLTRELIARVSREARFLAVNAQTNTTNFGFNLITKYPRADLVVIDELEARLAACDRESPLEHVVAGLGFQRIIVTMGARGALGYQGGQFSRAPGKTDNVVDTMGAGDAFLAMCAPFARAGFPMGDLVRIGNAAGAIKVGIVGHRAAVSRRALTRALAAEEALA